jgi:hypothetical protein
MLYLDQQTVEGLLELNVLSSVPTVTATAAGTLTLTAASTAQQILTGSTAGQNVKLPDATTLRIGWTYYIWNSSTQNVVVQNSDATTLLTLLPGNSVHLVLRVATPANGTWDSKIGHVRGHTIMSTDDHTDILTGTPTNGQVLRFRTSDSKWHAESANDAPKIKAGAVAAGSFSGNPKKAAVTFGTAFADANYAVAIGSQSGDNRTWTIESKSASGFTINANANGALTNPITWMAIANGEN